MTMRYHCVPGLALLVGLLLSLSAMDLAAQTGAIEGRVTHAETGEPLAGVEVTLAEAGRRTLSNEDGGFRIVDVPSGEQTVVASRLGFGTVETGNVASSLDPTDQARCSPPRFTGFDPPAALPPPGWAPDSNARARALSPIRISPTATWWISRLSGPGPGRILHCG